MTGSRGPKWPWLTWFGAVAGGLTMIQVDEYLVAASCWFIAAGLLCASLIRYRNWAWSRKRLMLSKFAGSLVLASLLVLVLIWTNAKRSDKQWSALLPREVNESKQTPNGPKFIGQVLGVHYLVHVATQSPYILTIAKIVNTGNQSIVENYNLSLRWRATELALVGVYSPTKREPYFRIVNKKDGSPGETYGPSDWLPGKTVNQPIANGGRAIGWLLGRVPLSVREIEAATMSSNKADRPVLVVRFRDAKGKQYVIDDQDLPGLVPDVNTPHMHYPGLQAIPSRPLAP